MVELADAPDSKSGGGNSVWVQLPPPAPYKLIVSMPRNLHCHFLKQSGAYHVSYTGPAWTMKNLFMLLCPFTSAGLRIVGYFFQQYL